MAADGPLADELGGASVLDSMLPGGDPHADPKGRPVVDYDVLVDTATVGGTDAWALFSRHLSALRQARTFAMLPLVSRNRLIGVLMLRDDRISAVDVELLQLLTVLTHFLGGALHNALSL